MSQPSHTPSSRQSAEFRLNSQSQPWRSNFSVSQLLEELEATGPGVAVERNGDVVRRVDHASTLVQPGDQIEVVRLVGGG